MAYEARFVRYGVEGHVATIALDRPERLNAVGAQMAGELGGAWQEAIADDGVRAVILTGEGRVFCAGRDIREQAERGGAAGRGPAAAGGAPLGYFGVPEIDKPIVAAVRGGAWGLGWFMCCGSDIVVAAEDARFAMSEIPTGIIGPAFIPLVTNVSWLAGSEIVLRGHPIGARRAYELGLVNHLAPAEGTLPLARELAAELAALPPRHVQATKRQLTMARPRPSAWQSAIEFPRAAAELMALDDTREAALAFAGKRAPVFRGR